MKARKEEFGYPKCPVCGKKIVMPDCIVQSSSFYMDNDETELCGTFHERCHKKIAKALKNGKDVTYDLFSHRMSIEKVAEE